MVGIVFPLVEIGLTDLLKCGRIIAPLATPVPTALEHAAAVWWARATELWCWFLIHFLLWNQSNIEEVLQVTYFQIISFASLNLTKIPPCEIKFRQYILILMQSFKLFSDLSIDHSSKRRKKNVNCRETRGKFIVYKCPTSTNNRKTIPKQHPVTF